MSARPLTARRDRRLSAGLRGTMLHVDSRDEQARRKRMRDGYKNGERAARTSLMPLDVGQFEGLMDAAHIRLLITGYDHTRRFTGSGPTPTAHRPGA